MNIGKLLVTKVVDGQDLNLLVQSGLDKAWLDDPDSIAVFDGSDRAAFLYILNHFDKYKEVPDREQISDDHNPSYRFEETDRKIEWLIDKAASTYKRSIVDLAVGDFVSHFDGGDLDGTINVARELIAKAERTTRQENTVAVLNEDAKDIDEWLDEEQLIGVPIGIPTIDEYFGGMKEGQLITLLGRNKGMKTWHMIKIAMSAWENGLDSVFFSVELNVEQIKQRMWSSLSQVPYKRIRDRDLEPRHRREIQQAAERLASDDVKIQIERNAVELTVLDLKLAIEKHQPHIVFVDGFYFMRDRETGKSGTNWEAHENLSKELKILAEDLGIIIVVSTQVQEKQHNDKAGVESRTMMGGTGLIKASDLVLGVDRPNELHYQQVSMLASRESELVDVTLLWNWDSMTFKETEGYDWGGGDGDANGGANGYGF